MGHLAAKKTDITLRSGYRPKSNVLLWITDPGSATNDLTTFLLRSCLTATVTSVSSVKLFHWYCFPHILYGMVYGYWNASPVAYFMTCRDALCVM